MAAPAGQETPREAAPVAPVGNPVSEAVSGSPASPSDEAGSAAPADAAADPGAAAASEAGAGAAPPVARSTAAQLVFRMSLALARTFSVTRRYHMFTPTLLWSELDIHDEAHPLTVDIVANGSVTPTRIVYMLPGGAMNFRSAFLAPMRENLASFFAARGYLVVGITPREDNVPGDTNNLSFMANWGMNKHLQDIRSVIVQLQPAAQLPYELLGHSYGAASALDYAAVYTTDGPARVIALDIYSIDPEAHPDAMSQAQRSYRAYADLIERKVYADDSYVGFKELIEASRKSASDPSSPTPEDVRATFMQSARGLIFLSLIDAAPWTARSPLTGLPSDWPLASSIVASRDDLSNYKYTDFKTIAGAADRLGSELISVAFARDYWSVVAANGVYALDWSAIKVPTIWINTELGYDDQLYAAQRIREAGNADVKTSVIPGYGHADILWSKTAAQDAWPMLLP